MKSYVRAKWLNVCAAPVFLHWSVLVIIGVCLATAISDPVVAVVAASCYFGMILVHEYGHAWIARALGYDVHSIKLSVIHGECVYEGGYESTTEEALIAWGGPLAQFAVAVPVWLLSLVPVIDESRVFGPFIAFFGYIGPLIALVNLAPSPHLDGSKAWALIPVLWREAMGKKKPRRRSGLKVVK